MVELAGPIARNPPMAEATYPPGHKPAMRVPKGGSMCKNCKFLGKDEKTCTSKDFIAWNGSKNLPEPYDEYCSDWYMRQERDEV